MTREAAIRRIARALEARSGRPWSLTPGRGWLRISAPPDRLRDGCLTSEDAAELAKLLGLEHPVDFVVVPAAEYDLYVYRAEAKQKKVNGQTQRGDPS